MDTQASLTIINKTQSPTTPYQFPSPTYGLKEAQYSQIQTKYSQDHPQQSSQVQYQGHMEALAETSTIIQETHGLLPYTATTSAPTIRSESSTLKVTFTPTMDDNQLFYGSSTTSTPDPSMQNSPRSVLPARPPSPTSVTSTSKQPYSSSTMQPALHGEKEAASTSTLYPSSTMKPALHGEKEAAYTSTPYPSSTKVQPAL